MDSHIDPAPGGDLVFTTVERRLKAEGEAAGQVPIIFLTAMDNEAARKKGMECGATEYLTKPFDPDRLIATLEKHKKKG